MTHTDLLIRLAEYLEAAGIPYMIAGSACSSYYSTPRTTNDLDIVIDPTPTQLDHWITLLGNQFYVSPEMSRDALRTRSMFNIIDLTTGIKADLIIRKNRPFSVEEFARRKSEAFQGRPTSFATPEDSILSKLEWNLITPSERQVQDAVNVAIAQWPRLDFAYLRKWAPVLGVATNLEELLRAAQEAQGPPAK